MTLSKKFAVVTILAVAGCGLAAGGALANGYDNPEFRGVPCVALSAHSAKRRPGKEGGYIYTATTRLENLCNMPVEVEYCITAVGGEEPSLCRDTLLRPAGRARVVIADSPNRLTGPRVAWRYLN